MSIDDIIREIQPPKKLPKIKPGDIVKVKQVISDKKKERVQIFEGIVIRVNGGTRPNATFVVRKISLGVGVEKTYPLYLPTISKIIIKKSHKTRRAKLYYLRKKYGRAAKMKEKNLRSDVVDLMKAIEDEEKMKEEDKKEMRGEEEEEIRKGEEEKLEKKEDKIEMRRGEEEKEEEKGSKGEKKDETKDKKGQEIEADKKATDTKK